MSLSQSPSTRPLVPSLAVPSRADQSPVETKPIQETIADVSAILEVARTAFEMAQQFTQAAKLTIIPDVSLKLKELTEKELQLQKIAQTVKIAGEEKVKFEADRKALEEERKTFLYERAERLRKDAEEQAALLQKSKEIPVPRFLREENAKEIVGRIARLSTENSDARQVRIILASLDVMDELQDHNYYMQLLARLYSPLKNLEQSAGPLIEELERLISLRKDLGVEVKVPRVKAPFERAYMNGPVTTKVVESVTNWAVIKDGIVKIPAEVR